MQWPIQKFWKAETEDNVSIPLRRYLSQMHIMNFTRFTHEKATGWKKIAKANGGGAPLLRIRH